MKSTLTLMLAPAIVFLALLASPASAGLLDLKIGGQVGASHTGGDIDESTFIGGGMLRCEVLSIITGELAVNYKKDEVPGGGEISTVPIQLSALITPLPLVYGTIGVGWYNINASDDLTDQVSELEDISQAALHLGGGIEVPVSHRLSVCGDLRYVFLDYDLESVSDDVFDSSASFSTITGGLLFKLF
jgi:hypothetical protein